MKALVSTSDFPTWGSGKGTGNPEEIWLWQTLEFDYRTCTALGKTETPVVRRCGLAVVCCRKRGTGSSSPGKCVLAWSLSWRSPLALTFSSVQFSRSVMSNSLWSHGLQHARPPCPSPLPEFTQTHVYWVGDTIQPSHPLSSPSPPAFNLSQHQGLFKRVSSSPQVAKVLEFQLQHQSFRIYQSFRIFRTISFRMDWLDLLIVQGTLKSLLQHHSSKASILWHSAFLIVQLSHP